ncbi:HIT family protein [Candidatus Parcubacteria bacterium]|jgi:histidine triad (HIT) family protein|nr:HIT family protein [Candidatus Parcubacteria bacterium]
MEDCIFCKVIKKEIPRYKVYEDDDVLGILDINPTRHGHVLVFPKKHMKNFEDADENTLSKIMAVVKKLGLQVKEKLPAESYNVVVNNDEAAGQIIPHIHFHIIPRNEGDGLKGWPQEPYPKGMVEEVMNKLKIN